MIGNHKRRMKDKSPQRVEMRNILGDFWNAKLYDMECGEGRAPTRPVEKPAVGSKQEN